MQADRLDDLRRTIEKCASHSQKIRQLFLSHEENEILRALVGRSDAERLVAEVRVQGGALPQHFEGSVAFIRVTDPLLRADEDAVHCLFGRLNSHFELFVPEIHGRRGAVHRFVDDSLMAVFEGPDHLFRAVDACLAIVERVRVANAAGGPSAARYGVAFGLGSGDLVTGGVGSLALGRFERSVLGRAVTQAALLKALAKPLEVLASPELGARLSARYRCTLDIEVEPLASESIAVCRLIGWLEGDAGARDVPTTEAALESAHAEPALPHRGAGQRTLISR